YRTHLADNQLFQRHEVGFDIGIDIGISRGQAHIDAFHIVTGLLHRDTRLQQSHRVHAPKRVALEETLVRLRADGSVNVGGAKVPNPQAEGCGNDSYDRAPGAGYHETLADHVAIRAELPLPKTLRDHHHRICAAAVFLGVEIPSENRIHAQDREE